MSSGKFSHMLISLLVGVALVATACGQGESVVEPGPANDDTTTTTTLEEDDGDDDGEVVTADADAVESTSTTAPANSAEGGDSDGADGDGDGADGSGDGDSAESPVATFEIDETSENAAVFTELAVSGLVLSLDEQSCADDTAATAVDAGTDEIDAVIAAVQDCASPLAIDDFASNLIRAGGLPLPPIEATCVSSKLQSTDEYRPFWIALLEEEPFDFLLADLEVQNRFLDLYADCVSVGRAVSRQAGIELSEPTTGCIDALYTDREFVRITIEADLSGNEDDLARIDRQLAGCLTSEERDALADS